MTGKVSLKGRWFEGKELSAPIDWTYFESLPKSIRFALDAYMRGDISFGRAAEISGVGYLKLDQIRARARIPVRHPQSTWERGLEVLVVSDASPLVYLGKADKLALLQELYREVIIPSMIWREILKPLEEVWETIPDEVYRIVEMVKAGVARVAAVKSENAAIIFEELQEEGLGPGESEGIAISHELDATFLTNDRDAYLAAAKRGVKAKWLTEILLEALRANLLRDVDELSKLLTQLSELGLWLDKETIKKTINEAKKY